MEDRSLADLHAPTASRQKLAVMFDSNAGAVIFSDRAHAVRADGQQLGRLRRADLFPVEFGQLLEHQVIAQAARGIAGFGDMLKGHVERAPLGRNVEEMLRVVDALQFTEEHGEVCPAGWNKGKAGMNASPDGVAKYLASHAKEL